MKDVQAYLYLDTNGEVVAVDAAGNRYRQAQPLGGLFDNFDFQSLEENVSTAIVNTEPEKNPWLQNTFNFIKGVFVKEDGSATTITTGLVSLLNRNPVTIKTASSGAAIIPGQGQPGSGGTADGVDIFGMNIPTWAAVLGGVAVVGGIVYVATN